MYKNVGLNAAVMSSALVYSHMTEIITEIWDLVTKNNKTECNKLKGLYVKNVMLLVS